MPFDISNVKPVLVDKNGNFWTTAEPEMWGNNMSLSDCCIQLVEPKVIFFGLFRVWKRNPVWKRFSSYRDLMDFASLVELIGGKND